MKAILGNGLIFSEGAEHTAQKKLMSPAFNHVSIMKMLPTFQKQIQRLVDYWSDEIQRNESGEIEVQRDLSRLVIN